MIVLFQHPPNGVFDKDEENYKEICSVNGYGFGIPIWDFDRYGENIEYRMVPRPKDPLHRKEVWELKKMIEQEYPNTYVSNPAIYDRDNGERSLRVIIGEEEFYLSSLPKELRKALYKCIN